MTAAHQVSGSAGVAGAGKLYTGEVVYIFAFDIAYEMARTPLKELLGQPVAQFAVDTSKRAPRQLFFYRAQMVRLPPLERFGPAEGGASAGAMRLERSIKLLPVGAVSMTVRVGFAVDRLEDLVVYHDLRFTNGVYLYDEVVQTVEEVRRELARQLVRPVAKLGNEEAYTVFCINAAPQAGDRGVGTAGKGAEAWLEQHRRTIAALLTEEHDPSTLSEQEAADTTSKYLSYYEDDLIVIDWDAALILDEPGQFEETLYLMELANLQLAELEAYDLILDDAIDNAYRDLARRRPLLGYNAAVQRSLKEIRVDMARLSDELSNSTKFFGEWHLARIYKTLSERFHLGDWHRSIDEKLRTLDDLYQLLQADRNNYMMLVLEITIVLLFVIDLVILGIQTMKP